MHLTFAQPCRLLDMRHALEQESKARRHAEDRHMEEISQRILLEKRILDLERAHGFPGSDP